MQTRRLVGLLSASFLIGVTLLCCQTAPNDQRDGLLRSDVADSTDSKTRTDSDAMDVSETDSGSPDASGQSPLFSDTSRWTNERSCEGTVEYPEVNEHYSEPSRGAPLDEGRQTAEEYLETRSNGGVRVSMIPNENLNPGGGRAYDLYSDSGDVEFHVYIYNTQSLDVVRTYRTNLTILMDYEPVEATITHWSDDRDAKLAEVQGSGINVPSDSQVDIFDITIPASNFAEARMYEIGLSLELNSFPHRTIGHSRRFVVYRNGYNRKSRPCSLSSLNEPLSDRENNMLGRIGTNNAILFSNDIVEYGDVDVVHSITPGETKRFYTSFISFQSMAESHMFFVPTLNGEPIHDGWYVETPPREPPQRGFVDARKSFEVTFPEEPGLYAVQIASWMDPFVMARTLDGQEVDGVRDSSGRVNSNVLRFRVEEPE